MGRAAFDSALDLFAGGGKMGALMRTIDWPRTPLGPVEAWPQALRTLVKLLLANRFQMLLWWGPEYIQLYNDAYRPVLGTKHPSAMGQRARECWPEIWHILQPLVDTPFRGGAATWMDDIFLEINRHGFVEETHFTIAYSPVPDEEAPGGIGGVLATIHEITEKVVGERRVVVLRDLGGRTVAEAQTAEAACAAAAAALAKHAEDVPFALLYLIDPEGTRARLAGAAGVEPGRRISPHLVELDPAPAAGAAWPLGEAVREERPQVVERLAERFEVVPPGPWSDPPHTALVVPIPSNKAHQPAGVLVAGISSRLALNENYRAFLELVAGQIAMSVATARALESERERAAALAELDRAKTAFFSNVSHEFRTPLTLQLGPLEDALNDAEEPLPPGQRERLEVAHRNSLRLLKLVNTLLDFSRIEAGRIHASFAPTDLASLTADLASTFRSATDRAGLSLEVACQPLPAPVYVDREMWEKIVLNLLSNAFKFTFVGGIRVALEPAEGAVRLVVADTGTGIPAAELPNVFKRFHRVRDARARTHEGTGIGLALVQELVKLHGGRTEVASELGRGTRFTVTLPTGTAHLPDSQIVEETATAAGLGAAPFVEEALRWLPGGEAADEGLASAPGGAASPSVASTRGARVLLADDNADMREYVARLLRGAGWSVETAADGAAALASAAERRPDLVLTDVMMPGLDGFALLRELRSRPGTSGVPVIMLSARAGEESRVEGLDAGADDYLVKPFTARELVARVGATLHLARLRREAEAALRASEQRWRLAADGARLGSWELDLDTLDWVASGQCKANFGRAPDAPFSYDELWAAIHPDDRARHRATLATAINSGAPFEEDYRCVWPDGTVHWLLARGRLLEPGADPAAAAPRRMIGVMLDITERKRSEQLILEQMRLLEHIAAGRPLEECVEALCAAVERLSPGARAVLRFADAGGGDALRVSHSTPVLGADGTPRASFMLSFDAPREPTEWERRLANFGAHVASIALERDRAVAAVETARAEAESAAAALRARTAQFETLLAAAPLGVYLVDDEFRVCEVNPTARVAFGDIPDLIGRDLADVMRRIWPDDYADEKVRLFRQTLESGAPHVVAEHSARRRDRGVTETFEWQIHRI
ncbi:MAG TPA: response regulator, partial [Gemmatimonadales bacterium]|nr:response regulator [Gemmatimonadales bacterium]